MSEAIPEDVEKLLARLHATAEELANIEHFEGWVPGCDYEPIFKGSADLLDARDKIAALMAERTRQEERVRVLEEALRPFASYLDLAAFDFDNSGNPLPDDQGMGWIYLTVGDFRRARAALAELLSPSTAMLIAGVKAMRNPDLDVTEKELALGWRAMIEKALGE